LTNNKDISEPGDQGGRIPGKTGREMGRNGDTVTRRKKQGDIRISGNGPELFSLII